MGSRGTEPQIGPAISAIRRQYIRLLGSILLAWTPGEVEAAVRANNLNPLFAPLSNQATRFAAEVNSVFMGAGKAAAEAATASWARIWHPVRKSADQQAEAAHGIIMAFDATNEDAVATMAANQLRLVTNFSQQQRDATNLALTQGVTEGLNPVDMARMIRSSVGLTAAQQNIVNNYRTSLLSGSADALTRALRDRRFDATVESAIADERILPAATIDRMVTRYAERWRNYRAEVISRTEAMGAVHGGDRAGWQAALDQVQSNPLTQDVRSSLVRTWVTAEDDRVRDSHVEMDGQEVGMDEPFISGLGNSLDYPGDPNAPPEDVIQCRCSITTEFRADAG